ncbi:hypothetical protein C8T65DRAFT_645924 [Cerioporus squamosus]|nr:hypothetical protein C8T65DRAFT_645924 [Cerioporus squamosus]
MVHADNILRLVVYTGGAVFLALRAYALSGGRYILTIPVFLLNTSFISPNIYMLSKLHARVLPAFIGCQSILSWDTDFLVLSTLIRVSRTAIILSEVIVVALTWSKTRRTLRKASPHMSQSGASTLPAVLLRNGILCFVLPIVMTSIVWALDEKSSQRITAEVVEYIGQARDALNSIVTSRFLLDLSELAARVEASAGSSPMSLGVPTLTGYLTPGLSEVPSVLFEDNVDEPVRMAHEV